MSRPAILLVDDEKTILDSLRGQLRRLYGAEYTYETAENVPEAWEVIEELAEDGAPVIVIVSDWLMPGTRGDEFLRDVRDSHPEVARILLTGQADPEAIQRCVDEALAHEIIFKPWSEGDLRDAIAHALSEAPEGASLP